ncbi:MAG: hypothetical protein Q9214_001290 [Letrouitia sp. 1 TL-2023]
MWEVDPETKSKVTHSSSSIQKVSQLTCHLAQLLTLQKHAGNSVCCDCSAPSPQWASPKFGTFICLTCAGLHRGLGVHISFVRSITMDAFKGNEILRMEKGGNKRWQDFWASKNGGRKWENVAQNLEAFGERYSGEVGEEWKERLGCEVEGRDFKGLPVKAAPPSRDRSVQGANRTASPARGSGMGAKSQKEMNEDFFARKGGENASRRADLPPSQGGKYAGFGSDPFPANDSAGASAAGQGGKAMPGVDDFQKDPVAALTKGFGWFTSTVGKGAKTVNNDWIQPNVQKLAEADLATQARLTAAQVAQNIQSGSKNAAESFNRFVEDTGPSTSSATRSKTAVEPERKDFWDSFGSPTEDENKSAPRQTVGVGASAGRGPSPTAQQGRSSPAPGKGSAIGTAAMRKKEKEDEKWEDF